MRFCYLVALKHVVVAQDIAQTIRDHDPDAEVIVEAHPTPVPGDRVPVMAFFGMAPADVQRLPAARDLLARGARLVLIGEEAEAAGESGHWWVLYRPFTSDSVLALLARAAEERGSQAAG